jgi:hypothetical protein
MKNTLRLPLLLAVMLLVLLPDPGRLPALSEERSYSSVSEALGDWRHESRGALSEPAILYLLEELELDWEYSPRPRYRGWDDVCVYRSGNGKYFIMVGAPAGEWGQFGPAGYCLVDTSGNKYWERRGYIDAPPKVSSQGTVVLRYADGRPDTRRSWNTLRIDFIGPSGDSLGSILWTTRITRPIQRRFLEEQARFSTDGDLLLMTMNLSDGLDEPDRGLNNTFLFAVRSDGSVAWKNYLGGFQPASLEIATGSDSLCVSGIWREKMMIGGTEDHGYMVFDLEGNLLESVITRHIDFDDVPE